MFSLQQKCNNTVLCNLIFLSKLPLVLQPLKRLSSFFLKMLHSVWLCLVIQILSQSHAFSAAEFCLLEWEALQLKIQTLSGFSIPNMILAISSLSSYKKCPSFMSFLTLETKSQTVRFSYTYRLEPFCIIWWSISCDYTVHCTLGFRWKFMLSNK